ncbi:MAG: polysaccharide biosynthesis C-terminal domain-containing protein [Myxococcota bacterium]|nr:polysaccharide biosynthesis C-terminal domain-containing protein [Myxococcota bacterium]
MTRSSLARDTVFNTLSFSLRTVGILIATVWVARSLGPENQGRFGFAHWLAAILSELSLWGLGFASARFVARAMGAGDTARACEAVAVATRWLLMSLFFVGAVVLPLAWFHDGELRGPLLAAVPLLITLTLYQWRIGVAWGLRRFDIALAGHAVFFSTLMPALYLALGRSEPVLAALIAFAGSRGLQTAVVWFWTSRALQRRTVEAAARAPTAAPRPPLVPLMRSYAIQMALLTFFGALLWESSELPLLRMATDDKQVGIYTVAFAIAGFFLRVPAVLALVLVPAAAELDGSDANPEEIGAMFRRAARLLTLLVAAPVAVVVVAAPTIVEALYGSNYAAATELVRLLAVPLLLNVTAAAGAQTLVGSGRQQRLLIVLLLALSLKVLFCLLLVPTLETRGTALAVGLTFLVSLVTVTWTAARTVPATLLPVDSRWLAQAGVAVTAALSAALCSWWLETSNVWVQTAGIVLGAGLGALVAALLLRPLATLDRDVLKELLDSRGQRWLSAAVCRISPRS